MKSMSMITLLPKQGHVSAVQAGGRAVCDAFSPTPNESDQCYDHATTNISGETGSPRNAK